MKTCKFLIIACVLLFNVNVWADIAIPRAESVTIKTIRNFPDFDFYYCVIPVSSYYDRGRHFTTHYDKVRFTPITLTPKKTFSINETKTYNKLYILALKKNSYPKDNDKLKTLIISAIQTNQTPDFYFFEIETAEEKDFRKVVYTIQKIGGSELKTTRKSQSLAPPKISLLGENNESGKNSGIEVARTLEENDFSQSEHSTYIAGGLFLTGLLTFFGLMYFKKSRPS